MIRPIRAASLVALAFPGCNDQPALRVSEAQHAVAQPVQLVHPAALSVEFSIPARDGFRALTFRRGSTVVRTLSDADAVYVKDLPLNVAPRGGFLQITQLDNGLAVAGTGERAYHDRAYCLFVSTQSACVVAKESGEFCGGDWKPDDSWVTPDGASIDLGSRAAARILELAAEDAFDDGDAAYSRENAELCRAGQPGSK